MHTAQAGAADAPAADQGRQAGAVVDREADRARADEEAERSLRDAPRCSSPRSRTRCDTPDGGVDRRQLRAPGRRPAASRSSTTTARSRIRPAATRVERDDQRRDRRGAAARDAAADRHARRAARAPRGARPAGSLRAEPRSRRVAAPARAGGGGVGIGLPYTGPERRADLRADAGAAARAGHRRRRSEAGRGSRDATLAAIAGARRDRRVGIVIAIATAPGSGRSTATRVAGARDAPRRSSTAIRPARDRRSSTANTAAIAQRSRAAQLVLGHAHARAQRERPTRSPRTQRALELTPDARGRHRRCARTCARWPRDAGSPTSSPHAFDAVGSAMTDDPEAKAALAARRRSARTSARRHAVRPVIERYKLGDVGRLARRVQPRSRAGATVREARDGGRRSCARSAMRARSRRSSARSSHGKTGTKQARNACLARRRERGDRLPRSAACTK